VLTLHPAAAAALAVDIPAAKPLLPLLLLYQVQTQTVAMTGHGQQPC
jgi:hypothetical protein